MASDKSKKIDREFCITDESVNIYGYRLLTSGLLLDEFKKNPIGFLMHDRDAGVVCRWEDFRIDNGKVYAKPVINLSHPNGAAIAAQVENGFYNAASVGSIVCLDASDDKALKLPGQKGLTITEWFPRECSLVDIPGNYNALANLYDADDNVLDLADFVKPKNRNMKNIVLAAGIMTALQLDENAPDDVVNNELQKLIDLAAKLPQFETELSDVRAQLTTATQELNDLKAETTKQAVADLIGKGKADKKLTNALADKLAAQYATNPEGLKELLAVMPAQTVITEALPGDASDLADKSWDELYKEDKLEEVRTKYPDLYEKKRKEKYNN